MPTKLKLFEPGAAIKSRLHAATRTLASDSDSDADAATIKAMRRLAMAARQPDKQKKMRRDTSKQSSEHAHGLRGAVVMKPKESLKKIKIITFTKLYIVSI